MTYNPNTNDPITLNIEKIKQGLSQAQIKRILYECMLLNIDQQQAIRIIPHMFNDNVTASNKVIVKEDSPTNNYEHYNDPIYGYGDDFVD